MTCLRALRPGRTAATLMLTLSAALLTAGLTARAAETGSPDAASAAPASKDLKLKDLRVGKLLFLGNSITQHGPKPEIGWAGDWGMAASALDKDYVHVLAAQIGKAAGGQPRILAKNIADFERGHPTYDIAAGMKDELAFRPDVVIVAIGENVPASKPTKPRPNIARHLSACSPRSPKTVIRRSLSAVVFGPIQIRTS